METPAPFTLNCPVPPPGETVTLAHGGGGRLMQQLLQRCVLPAFNNTALNAQHDGALLQAGSARLAFTTDSFVVRPLFFPGGDIGSLAVNGTVNDLAMCGARPLALSCALILEEGLPFPTLERVLASMQAAAKTVGVPIVTGDTKVVERGKGDGIFVTTAGVGLVEIDQTVAPSSVRAGDAIVLSGDVGRHGIAVLAARENLPFETPIESDCAPLWSAVKALLDGGISPHCLRDLTRGGLAAALNEISVVSGTAMEIHESAVTVAPTVRGACELLGLDPLYIANEGRFIAIVPAEQADAAVAILRNHFPCQDAAVIGAVTAGQAGTVLLRTVLGSRRVLDLPASEPLPRIC